MIQYSGHKGKEKQMYIYLQNKWKSEVFPGGLSFLILHTWEKSEGIVLNAAECQNAKNWLFT